MQVFQEPTKKFLCHNKYYGRQLDVDGVKRTLHQFLNNGYVLRVGLIDTIVEKLQSLHEMIKKHPSYRFYGTSLLVMYEGRQPTTKHLSPTTSSRQHSNGHSKTGSVQLKPAQNVSPKSSKSPVKCDKCAKEHVPSESSGSRARTCLNCINNGETMHPAAFPSPSPQDSLTPPKQQQQQPSTSSPKQCECRLACDDTAHGKDTVDVRMIDFAHATHSGLGDTTAHDGPDRGYLLGLQNLISMFCELKQTHA